jgi:hypothetical protein
VLQGSRDGLAENLKIKYKQREKKVEAENERKES